MEARGLTSRQQVHRARATKAHSGKRKRFLVGREHANDAWGVGPPLPAAVQQQRGHRAQQQAELHKQQPVLHRPAHRRLRGQGHRRGRRQRAQRRGVGRPDSCLLGCLGRLGFCCGRDGGKLHEPLVGQLARLQAGVQGELRRGAGRLHQVECRCGLGPRLRGVLRRRLGRVERLLLLLLLRLRLFWLLLLLLLLLRHLRRLLLLLFLGLRLLHHLRCRFWPRRCTLCGRRLRRRRWRRRLRHYANDLDGPVGEPKRLHLCRRAGRERETRVNTRVAQSVHEISGPGGWQGKVLVHATPRG